MSAPTAPSSRSVPDGAGLPVTPSPVAVHGQPRPPVDELAARRAARAGRAPTLAEVGADQVPAYRTCGRCGTICPAAMPALEDGTLILLDAEAGLYDRLVVLEDDRWQVRTVDDGEAGLPYTLRRATHACPRWDGVCQTPGHADRPALLYPGGRFCGSCGTSPSRTARL